MEIEKIENMNPEFIKEYLEKKTNIPDLSIRSRKRSIVEIRFIGFQLTKMLCERVTLTGIGEPYKKDHATVINGLKKFEELKNQFCFKEHNKFYESCLEDLLKLSGNEEYKALKSLQSVKQVKHLYKIKVILLMDKYHAIINKQNKKLFNFSNRTIFDEIAELDDRTFYELETRINAFLLMNKNKQLKNI